MFFNLLRSLFILFLFSNLIFSQQFGSWENHSSMNDINDIYVDSSGIWSATTGGIFYYDFASQNYTKYNKAISSSVEFSINQVTAITKDNNGKIWAGNFNGYIYVLDVASGLFNRIGDIYISDKTKKQITDLSVKGDTIIATTEFGLSFINANNFSFYDSYYKFGNIATDVKVNNLLIYNNRFVLSTESGIVIQKENSVNLGDPNSWNTYTTNNGLPSNYVYKVVNFNNQLYAFTDAGCRIFQNGSWEPTLVFNSSLNISLDQLPVLDSELRSSELLLLTNSFIYSFNGTDLIPLYNNYNLKNFEILDNERIFASSRHSVVDFANNTELAPNGPSANLFVDMDIDNKGNLWVATGKDGAGSGFYKFDDDSWTTFNTGNTSQIRSNDYWRVFAAPDNKIYLGNWGTGFLSFDDGKIDTFSYYNTDLMGIPTAPPFVVIHGLDVDSKGNLWILNYQPLNREYLIQFNTKDSTYNFYRDPITTINLLTRELVVDANDTKWFTTSNTESTSGTSLYYMNESRPLYSSDVNGWGIITSTDLRSTGNTVSSINYITVDNRNELWIGTGSGIRIITNPTNPKSSISSVIPLSGQIINSIAVDPLNQKWVGTQQGVYLLSPDGLNTLAYYNSANSPLPDNDIRSIAIDKISGKIYFGTDYGLSSLQTFAVSPKTSLDQINIYPNPIYIDGNIIPNIVIDGLVRESDIKIMTISGKIIRTLTTPGGGTAIWDGRNENGDLVSSGVYIFIIYDREGNNIGVSKAAVLRK